MAQPNKVIKSVSFNKNKPEDVRLLKAISRRNFSGFVKKLILAHLEEKGREKPTVSEIKPTIAEEEPEQVVRIQPTAEEKLESMKNQIKKTDNTAGPKLFTPR